PNKGMVVMFILIAGLTFNMWEYFPQNAILMYLWGMVLGTGYQSVSAPLQAGRMAASEPYYRRPS
ncbi:MAG: O-antigen ligase family protein, partial [Methylobacter sp.]